MFTTHVVIFVTVSQGFSRPYFSCSAIQIEKLRELLALLANYTFNNKTS